MNILEKKAIIERLRRDADKLWALQKSNAALIDDEKALLKQVCENLHGLARRLEKGAAS
jgi:hypothetical protein